MATDNSAATAAPKAKFTTGTGLAAKLFREAAAHQPGDLTSMFATDRSDSAHLPQDQCGAPNGAASSVAETRPKKPKGTYYRPPTVICDVPGVVKRENGREDCYTGTAEALIAAGLVTLDMLPGQPGRPFSAVTYRPMGCGPGYCHYQPGYMKVSRNLNGTFRVALTVSEEEQARRARELEAEQAKWRAGIAASVECPVWANLTISQRSAAGDYYIQHGCLPDWATRPSHLRLVWSAPPAQP